MTAVPTDIGPIPFPGPNIPLPSWLDPTQGGKAIIRSVAGGFLDAISKALASAVDTLGKGLLNLITGQTSIDLRGGWWAGPRAASVMTVLLFLAKAVMIGCLFAAVISGVLRGSPGAALKAVTVEIALSVLGIIMVATLVQSLASAVDWASNRVLAQVPADLGHFLTTGGGTAALGAPAAATGGLLGVVFAALFFAAFIILYLELLFRSAAIYLLVAFAPLALAGRVWERLGEVWRALLGVIVAFVVAKLVIAVALGLGSAALAGTPGVSTGDAIRGALLGASIVLVAAFMPFMLLRLIPMLAAAGWGAEARRHGSAKLAAGISTAEQVAGQMSSFAAGGFGGGGGAATSAGAGGTSGGNSGGASSVSPVAATTSSTGESSGQGGSQVGVTPVGLPPGPTTAALPVDNKKDEGKDKT